MWLWRAVVRTFNKKLFSVLYSIWHQYKLNLWNKAGWRLHFAVHAYCAFYGWKYNTTLNPPPCIHPSQFSDRNHAGLPQRQGEQHSYPGPWAEGAKGSEPCWQVVKASRLIPSTVIRDNATIPNTPQVFTTGPGIWDPAVKPLTCKAG